MINNEKIKIVFDKLLNKWSYKIYNSNVGFIVVPYKSKFVYKIFFNQKLFFRELNIYNLLRENSNILIPKFKNDFSLKNFFVLKLENVRTQYERKNNILDLDLKQIADILYTIHSFSYNSRNLILWDIHSSNFYEIKYDQELKLWIFDFSSSKYWDIEEDIANLYIEIWINDSILKNFLKYYWNNNINYLKIYYYSISELYERIKNGMNLSNEKINIYNKMLLSLRYKLWKLSILK